MGEMQSKTPEQIVAGLTGPMVAMLLNGRYGEGSSFATIARIGNGTREALVRRGLLGGDNRWTALGREAARAIPGYSHIATIGELHQLAIAEDAERFPPKPAPARVNIAELDAMIVHDALPAHLVGDVAGSHYVKPTTPNLLPGDRVTLATTPGSIWEVVERYVGEDGTPWLKLGLLERKSGPMIGHYVSSPASAVRRWTDPSASRPRIVDEIINRGPVLPMDVVELRVRSAADFNALRDYLLRCPAETPDAERVIRRAQYVALRAVAVAAATDPLLADVTLNIVSRVAAALGVPTWVAEGLPGDV